jgi:hypothetical protein
MFSAFLKLNTGDSKLATFKKQTTDDHPKAGCE